MRIQHLLLFLAVLGLSGCLGGSGADPAAQGGDPGGASSGADVPLTTILEGYVLAEDGTVLEGALLTLIEQRQTATADPYGYYRFVNIPAGSYQVEAALADYRSLVQPAQVVDGFSTMLNFTLKAVADEAGTRKTQDFTGTIACGFMVAEDPQTGTHETCGQYVPGDLRVAEFDIDPGALDAVLQFYWEPSTALANRLTAKVEFVLPGGTQEQAHQFVELKGKIAISESAISAYAPAGGKIRVTVDAGPGVFQDPVPQGVGLALVQRFEVDFVTFFGQPAPEEFNSR